MTPRYGRSAAAAATLPPRTRKFTCFGIRYRHPELGYEGAYVPESRQMLYRWDGVYPLPTFEADWYTTYYGGTGFYSDGHGIQYSIDQGPLVQPIINAGTPSSVAVYELCGSYNVIPGLHYEHTGPSDGAVFINSCRAPDGIANLAGRWTVALNHLQLGWHTTGMSRIVTWLG